MSTKKAVSKSSKPPAKKSQPSRKKRTPKTPAARKATSAETKTTARKASASNGSAPSTASKNGRSKNAHTARKPEGAAATITTAKGTKLVSAISVIDQPDVQEKLRDLIKLAKEQGYLTFDDLNEALPDNVNDPDEMETIMGRLRGMEIDIIDASDVDRYKDGKKDHEEEEEEKPETKLDILDDPVRMYLKQMGQVPLLTREQEVEISKRIEEAELNVQKFINRFGFIARAYLDLARKLQEGRERFDRVILDKKIESRERYMKQLPKLCQNLEAAAANCIAAYKNYLAHGGKNHETKSYHEFSKLHSSIQRIYPKFFF